LWCARCWSCADVCQTPVVGVVARRLSQSCLVEPT
jgi:hypothetical protein